MTNAMYYAKQLTKFKNTFMWGLDEDMNIVTCDELGCTQCGFYKTQYCIDRKNWLESEYRPNGQTLKSDAGKPRLTLCPTEILYAVTAIREYGVAKYGESGASGWKAVGVERYRDAAYRHWLAYLDDPHGTDAESGLPHLWHLSCNIAFLCELEKAALRGEA